MKIGRGSVHKERIALDIVISAQLVFRAAKAIDQVIPRRELPGGQRSRHRQLEVQVLAEQVVVDAQVLNLAVFHADPTAPVFPAVVHQGIVGNRDISHGMGGHAFAAARDPDTHMLVMVGHVVEQRHVFQQPTLLG